MISFRVQWEGGEMLCGCIEPPVSGKCPRRRLIPGHQSQVPWGAPEGLCRGEWLGGQWVEGGDTGRDLWPGPAVSSPSEQDHHRPRAAALPCTHVCSSHQHHRLTGTKLELSIIPRCTVVSGPWISWQQLSMLIFPGNARVIQSPGSWEWEPQCPRQAHTHRVSTSVH